MSASKIEWTEHVWNPVRGCSRIATGCRNCYAEWIAARRLPGMAHQGEHFAHMTPAGPRWTGRVELIPEMLDVPLKRRKPTTWFVNSMSDLFHEALPDEAIDRVFAVMALCPQHRFICLTKRGERMHDYITWLHGPSGINRRDYVAQHIPEWVVPAPWPQWPLPNVVLGVSASTQADADEQILWLLGTPAACRMVSLEPLVGPVNLRRIEVNPPGSGGICFLDALSGVGRSVGGQWPFPSLGWVVVGGESGPGARPCDVGWIRSIVRQCADAGVACFVKQLGARIIAPEMGDARQWVDRPNGPLLKGPVLRDRKGGDPSEWPADLRVRQVPEVR